MKNLHLLPCTFGRPAFLLTCPPRYALIVSLGVLLSTMGCATFRVQEQDRVSFERAKEVVREVTSTINAAAKPSAPLGGETQVMLQSIPRSEADITGSLGLSKIAAADVGNLKAALITYENGVSDLVKAATSDQQHYSLTTQQSANLATKVDSVRVMLAAILLNVDAFIGTQRDKVDKNVRLAVSTLGSAFMALDTIVMQKLSEKEAKGANVTDARKQWIDAAGTWLDVINSALKSGGGPIDPAFLRIDKLTSALKTATGSDNNPFVELGLNLAVSKVNSYIPRGTLNDDTKRILNIIQTEFDKIVMNYNTQHRRAS